MTRSHHDVVSAVEAAYRLDLAPDTWLRAVTEPLKPLLDVDAGAYASSYKVSANGLLEIDDVVSAEPLRRTSMRVASLLTQGNAPPFYAGEACFAGYWSEVMPPDFMHWVRVGSEAVGVVDFCGLLVSRRPGHGVQIGAAVRGVGTMKPRERKVWHRVAVHLQAALTLQEALMNGGKGTQIGAVLDASGRTLAAQGALTSSAARRLLRDATARMDQARRQRKRADPERALELWQGLIAGQWSLVDAFDTDGRRLMVVFRRAPIHSDPRRLSKREQDVLECYQAGMGGIETAHALGISTSTVSTHLKRSLHKLGLRSAAEYSRVVARLSSGYADGHQVHSAQSSFHQEALAILGFSFEIPNKPELTPAERALAQLLLQGQSRRSMATARGVSVHTIDNQLARLYTKLHAGSRAEAVRSLLEGP